MSTQEKQIKIIFMGTPEFSVPILDALITNYNVISVVTQPDKKVGRKQEIIPSPIKKLALKNEIEVLQPEKIRGNDEFLEKVKLLGPDLIVVAAYGLILPRELLDIPRKGTINVHGSVLPKLRGASPIQTAIWQGLDKTGITIMLMNDKMDEGDILSVAEADINSDETFQSLHDKLSILGTHLLIDTLPKYLSDKITPHKQDDSQATYCNIIKKEDGKIDWNKSAKEIDRQIRALNPWPGTYTFYNDKKLKVIKSKVYKVEQNGNPGEVFFLDDDIVIYCGIEALKILELQLEGKTIMTDKEFLNGYKNIIGQILK